MIEADGEAQNGDRDRFPPLLLKGDRGRVFYVDAPAAGLVEAQP